MYDDFAEFFEVLFPKKDDRFGIPKESTISSQYGELISFQIRGFEDSSIEELPSLNRGAYPLKSKPISMDRVHSIIDKALRDER